MAALLAKGMGKSGCGKGTPGLAVWGRGGGILQAGSCISHVGSAVYTGCEGSQL